MNEKWRMRIANSVFAILFYLVGLVVGCVSFSRYYRLESGRIGDKQQELDARKLEFENRERRVQEAIQRVDHLLSNDAKSISNAKEASVALRNCLSILRDSLDSGDPYLGVEIGEP